MSSIMDSHFGSISLFFLNPIVSYPVILFLSKRVLFNLSHNFSINFSSFFFFSIIFLLILWEDYVFLRILLIVKFSDDFMEFCFVIRLSSLIGFSDSILMRNGILSISGDFRLLFLNSGNTLYDFTFCNMIEFEFPLILGMSLFSLVFYNIPLSFEFNCSCYLLWA